MLDISSLPELSYKGGKALGPIREDLQRLYDLVVARNCFTVLEFGCGYSTYVIAEALLENKERFEALEDKPTVRNSNMFKLFSVDTSKAWLSEVRVNKPKYLKDIINLKHSPAGMMIVNYDITSAYANLPNIVPDLIYLDGPDPAQVEGSINGLSFKCKERTPVASDILLMESTLLPGTAILVDGRTNNARFLRRNLQRRWSYEWNPFEDYSLFILDEARLGNINVLGVDV